MVLLMPEPAGAQSSPSLTVTPSSALVDEQTVTLRGAGWEPGARISFYQCIGNPALPGTFFDVDNCGPVDGPRPVAIADETGSFAATYVVLEAFDFIGRGGGASCRDLDSATQSCAILALDLENLAGTYALISFGPPVPMSFRDCRNGQWRNHADGAGRPFPNQGRCVSYIARRR
jgi:hypothetical protein